MWLRFGHIFCLGAFLPLDYFKFDVITFLKAFIPFRLDGAIVNKDIGTIITTDKPEALGVIEPLNFTFNSRHVPYSTGPSEHGQTCVPGPSLIYLGLPLLKGGTQVAEGNDNTSITSQHFYVLYPSLAFSYFAAIHVALSTCLFVKPIVRFAGTSGW